MGQQTSFNIYTVGLVGLNCLANDRLTASVKTYKLTFPHGRKIFMLSYTPEVCIERVYSSAVIRLDWYRDWHLKLVPFPALVLSLLTTQSALQHKPHSHSQTVEPFIYHTHSHWSSWGSKAFRFWHDSQSDCMGSIIFSAW